MKSSKGLVHGSLIDFTSKLMVIRQILQPIKKIWSDGRESVLDRSDFVLALIFGCILTSGKHRSIDGLCRIVKRLTRKQINRAAFRRRLDTKILTEYLCLILSNLIEKGSKMDLEVLMNFLRFRGKARFQTISRSQVSLSCPDFG
jgi:hypothetical protein